MTPKICAAAILGGMAGVVFAAPALAAGGLFSDMAAHCAGRIDAKLIIAGLSADKTWRAGEAPHELQTGEGSKIGAPDHASRWETEDGARILAVWSAADLVSPAPAAWCGGWEKGSDPAALKASVSALLGPPHTTEDTLVLGCEMAHWSEAFGETRVNVAVPARVEGCPAGRPDILMTTTTK